MKVFIWKRVRACTAHYHSDGGVVVFADDEERARQIANTQIRSYSPDDGLAENGEDLGIRAQEMPDEVRQCEGEEAVFIFPDSGCC